MTSRTNKKGVYFSFEAVLAITVLLGAILLINKTYIFTPPRVAEDKMSEDIINILSNTKITDINNIKIIEKIKSEEITDYDSTILEVIGKLWIQGKKDLASEIAKNITLDILDSDMEFAINIEDNDTFITIYNTTVINNTDRLVTNRRMISGIEMEKPIEGITSKSLLKSIGNKSSSVFAYFGGFIGQGNITRTIYIPDIFSIENIFLEADIGTKFEININGNFCNTTEFPAGLFFPPIENRTIKKYDLSDCSNYVLSESDNEISIVFENEDINLSYIGGGFFHIKYFEKRMYEEPFNETKYYLPMVSGVINIFSSISFPEKINEINLAFSFFNNYSSFFTIGDKLVFESNGSETTQTITLDNATFFSIVNISEIENKTVPIRFSTKNFTNRGNTKKYGNGDAILVTDVSGSMDWRFDSHNSGINRVCTDPNLELVSSKRISVAKCINKDFIDNMLYGIEGNRVGLSSYEQRIDDYTSLTTNITDLKSEVDTYFASGSTCISCGIMKAIELLAESKSLINTSSTWKYEYGFPSGEPTYNNGYWYEESFNDSSWNTGITPIGFETMTTDLNTTLPNNGGNYYFRKTFFKNSSDVFLPKVYVFSDDNAQVFINGQLIINDTYEHDATYWNIEEDIARRIFFDGFEDGTLSGWTVDSVNDGTVIQVDNDPYQGNYNIQLFGDDYATNYAWFQRSFDLSLTVSPFLEFYVAYEDTESTDELFVDIYDGTWHNSVYRGYNNNNHYNFYDSSYEDYKRIKIELSDYNLNNAITIRFRTEVTHREQSDNIQIDNIAIRDYDVLKAGYNTIAVKVNNDDTSDAKFELLLTEIDTQRKKAMLVMSDGQANYCYQAVDSSWDCSDSDAANQAIQFACLAHRNYNIDIYSVAFGYDADTTVLQSIADCDNSSHFFVSNNVTGLQEIYKTIAEDMLKEMVIAETQNFEIIGNFTNSVLYGNSSITIKSQPKTYNEYGTITATFIERINSSNPIINIPPNVKILDAKVTSYSSEHWTKEVIVNGIAVYNISEYGVNFTNLGDPFIVSIPTQLLTQTNTINISSTDVSMNDTFYSNNNSIIYTLSIDASTGYTDVLEFNEGCNWTIEFEDISTAQLSIPSSYSGSKTCEYSNSSKSFNSSDTIDVAVYNLLSKLDFDKDGRVFVKFNENDFEIYLMSIPKVPYMWGPSIIEMNIWKEK
ncbi:VWA domain-containing protein [Candidatus Woesearchaeota archaeon]|nr:VWA domain-containing protein [Candidatus Woesearchaeota archaeon]